MRKVIFVLALCLPALGTAQETLYIQSAQAKLLAQPRFGADVVSKAVKGSAVELLKEEGRWCRISAGGKTGWVSKFVVSSQKPLNKVTILRGDDEENIDANARRRASAVTTAGAARGLAADGRKRISESSRMNYHALREMESLSVSDDEALTFLAEGLGR